MRKGKERVGHGDGRKGRGREDVKG